MAGFSIGKPETAKTSEVANSKNDARIRSGMEHFSRWDLGKGLGAGFNFDKLRDPCYTDKSERLKNCPVAERFVSGVRGEGKALPKEDTETGARAKEWLVNHGMDGIYYHKGYPDFSSVAHDSVRIDMTGVRLDNYAKAYRELASQWSEQKKDGRDNWKVSDVKAYIKEKDLAVHECHDRKTVQLVPKVIHEAYPHCGGCSECSARENALERR